MWLEKLDKEGCGILKNALDEQTTDDLRRVFDNLYFSNSVRQRRDSIYGVRNLLNIVPAIRTFAESAVVSSLAQNVIGEKSKVVRAIFFDKTPAANWKVPWHQDLTIAVKEKCEARGFTVWTRKSGVEHVQPPVEILERMVTLRFALDDEDQSNGALKVIPQSHRGGRLSAAEIKRQREANEMRLCSVKKGDCLIMRPLILHSSSAGTSPKRRRVVHLEFSADELPNGLDWYGS